MCIQRGMVTYSHGLENYRTIYKSKHSMIDWYYFIFISSLWQILVCEPETPERNFLHKVVLQYFWTPCMWYNLSSFTLLILFTIHSCLESLVSSGSVLDYYGYNALIGLTITLFYFAIMKASIKNSNVFYFRWCMQSLYFDEIS